MRHLLFLICCLPYSAFAFFCPNGFAQIDFGNTLDQVTQACGKPDKETTKEVEAKAPQEWTYYIPQPIAPGNMTQQQPPGMLKATINFDKDGKVVYMGVNGVGLGSSTICGNTIQLGATIDQVQAACGKADSISKQQLNDKGAPQQKTTITEMIYGSATLMFTNGILTSRK